MSELEKRVCTLETTCRTLAKDIEEACGAV
jgi:hypothetical protein